MNYVSLAKQEEYRRDAFGNPLFEGTLGETNRPTPLTYQYGVNGRLLRREANLPTGTPMTCGYTYPDTLRQTYDVFGNLSRRNRATYTGGAPGSGCTETGTALDYEFHWYGADNKLMVLQRDAGSPDRTVRTGTWEEYHYDALGRRIRIRERREDLANGSNMESALTQVLWDGDRLLAELRSQPPNGQGGGASSRYGTLAYIHGRELDAPLALTDGRILIPDWRGAYQGSVFASGAPADCATGQVNPCMAIEFPAGNIAATFRQFVVSGSGVTYTWRGSLIGAGRDGSGLMYRRNRYYDPLAGNFTQTDPIGLAGGLNLYGFAAGDPVNHGDPFGLAVCSASSRGRRALERVSNSSIEWDENGCVSDPSRVTFRGDRKKWGQIQDLFIDLVRNPLVFTLVDGRAPASRCISQSCFHDSTRTAYVDPSQWIGDYPLTYRSCRFLAWPADYTMAGLVAHELIGHATAWLVSLRTGGGGRHGHAEAFPYENTYHRAAGEPTRCG